MLIKYAASTLSKKDEFPIDMLLPQIAGLNAQVPKSHRARVKSATQDIKIEEESKSPTEAFEAVQFANKVIEDEIGQLAIINRKASKQEGLTPEVEAY